MASLAAQAVERARSGYDVTFDYSSDSVKDVAKLRATKYELKPVSTDDGQGTR